MANVVAYRNSVMRSNYLPKTDLLMRRHKVLKKFGHIPALVKPDTNAIFKMNEFKILRIRNKPESNLF